ncbi:hypothetical protein [Serratia marcescens]|uniref:hypothetical protein n=1 Tax=Serratia marcescens TaxID=615 RepID=UPI0032078D89
MTTHSNPLNSREVCLQLRHFNQVIGQQCRNMVRQNTTCPCCLTDIATGCDAGIKLCGQQLAQPNPQTPLFRQIRNLLLDLRAEAIGVHRIDVLNRTNNEISWLLRELYFETF